MCVCKTVLAMWDEKVSREAIQWEKKQKAGQLVTEAVAKVWKV